MGNVRRLVATMGVLDTLWCFRQILGHGFFSTDILNECTKYCAGQECGGKDKKPQCNGKGVLDDHTPSKEGDCTIERMKERATSLLVLYYLKTSIYRFAYISHRACVVSALSQSTKQSLLI